MEALLTTLVSRISPERNDEEAVLSCQRFLRSLLRVFVICELEKISGTDVITNNKRKR